jgi:hypothetical protein
MSRDVSHMKSAPLRRGQRAASEYVLLATWILPGDFPPAQPENNRRGVLLRSPAPSGRPDHSSFSTIISARHARP